MMLTGIRRAVARAIHPEGHAAFTLTEDATHAQACARWLAQEREILRDEPTRQQRFEAIAAVVAGRKTLDAGCNTGVGPGVAAAHFQKQSGQDGILHPACGLEKGNPVLVHRGVSDRVNAAQGKAGPGQAEGFVEMSWRARMRVLWTRIENGWIGDVIGVVALFGSLWVGFVLADALAGGAL